MKSKRIPDLSEILNPEVSRLQEKYRRGSAAPSGAMGLYGVSDDQTPAIEFDAGVRACTGRPEQKRYMDELIGIASRTDPGMDVDNATAIRTAKRARSLAEKVTAPYSRDMAAKLAMWIAHGLFQATRSTRVLEQVISLDYEGTRGIVQRLKAKIDRAARASARTAQVRHRA